MQTIDDIYYFTYEGSNLNDSLFNDEWILTDGLGGWASQSISGALTRRYHSLFLINLKHGKFNCVPKIEEFVGLGDLLPLSTNVYNGVVYPEGHLRLQKVLVGPTVRYYFGINEGLLIKEIFKPKGAAQTLIRYQWNGNYHLNLTLIPLFSFTGFHSLRQRTNTEIVSTERRDNGVKLKTLDGFDVFLQTGSFDIQDNVDWFYDFKLITEQDRGLDYNCDLFTKIKLTKVLKPNTVAYFGISNQEYSRSLENDFASKYEELLINLKKYKPSNNLAISKVTSTLDLNIKDYFIQTNRGNSGIIGGYHWFEEWGRDTFITLSLLTDDEIESDKNLQEFTLGIFKEFFSANRNGILPNRIFGSLEREEGVRAEYNSVDALLWAIIALYKFQKSLDKKILQDIWNIAFTCLDEYLKGTDFEIKVVRDLNSRSQLLLSGDQNTQLTWMDARVNGNAVTPRNGACVEINALWYNSLRICSEMSKDFGKDERSQYFEGLALESYIGFRRSFMMSEKGYLADCIVGNEIDYAFRPNQIFAMSLPYPLLELREARMVLFKIEKELLTDFAIRTLNQSNINYKPLFQGGPWERDSAYHQGTAWPWLLGAYCDAVLKFAENDLRPGLEKVIDNLCFHVYKAGCGHVSEVFGGDDNRPGGTIAQAWSTAALRYCIQRLKA